MHIASEQQTLSIEWKASVYLCRTEYTCHTSFLTMQLEGGSRGGFQGPFPPETPALQKLAVMAGGLTRPVRVRKPRKPTDPAGLHPCSALSSISFPPFTDL